MPTANEAIQDSLIRHQVALQRYTAGEVGKIISLLDATQADVEAQLTRRLLAIADGRPRSALVTERLQKLLANIRALRLAAYREAGKVLTADLVDLGRYEADFAARAIQSAAPVELALGVTTTLDQVGSIVRSKPFQGLILRDWVADLAAKELTAVERAINIGMAEGEGIPEIVRRIVGSKRAGVRGVLDISRRHAETWVRTAVSHTANETRDALYLENQDVVEGVYVIVTLDDRTCPICIPRDGKVYSLPDYKPVGHSIPWGAGPGRYHPKDRCTSGPKLASWKKLGIDLKEAPEGTRASMDGLVPGGVTYDKWIQRQPASVQNDVLGPVRARAMRSGRLKWDQMYTLNGELRGVRELGIFDGAGVSGAKPVTRYSMRSDIVAFENRHIASSVEHARAYDSKGRLLGEFAGSGDSVTIPASARDRLSGGVMTHNHPVTGESFSKADIQFAQAHGLKEIRAIGTTPSGTRYAYSAKPGREGWGEWSSVNKALSSAETSALKRIQALKKAGAIDLATAKIAFGHMQMEELSKLLGIIYSRTEV